MKNFLNHDKVFIVVLFLLLSGCYSSLPIEFSKVSDYKEISKIKLKDNSVFYFNNGECQLLSASENEISFTDKTGLKKTINYTDIQKFYTYRVDGTKVLFSAMWITAGIIVVTLAIMGGWSPGG